MFAIAWSGAALTTVIARLGRCSLPETSVMVSISRTTVGKRDEWSARYSTFISMFWIGYRRKEALVAPWLQMGSGHAKVVT